MLPAKSAVESESRARSTKSGKMKRGIVFWGWGRGRMRLDRVQRWRGGERVMDYVKEDGRSLGTLIRTTSCLAWELNGVFRRREWRKQWMKTVC